MSLTTVRPLNVKSEAELEQLLSETLPAIEEGLHILERQVRAGRMPRVDNGVRTSPCSRIQEGPL